MNIKVRLTLWYLLIVSLLVALFGAVAYVLLVNGLSRNTVDPWDMRMADITNTQDGGGVITGFKSVSGDAGLRDYNILEVSGSKLLESVASDGTISIPTLGNKPILVDKEALLGPNISPERQTWVYVFVPKSGPSDLKLIVVTQSDRNLASILGVFKQTVLISALITLIVAGLLGFFLVWLMLRPLHTIIGIALEIDGNHLNRRLKIDRKDELGELAMSLNKMFEHVETAFDAERQVTADLSHELRTPLAIAQAEASLALTRERSDNEYRKSLETVSHEITHLSSVTNRLLFLAKSENGSSLEKGELDLRELLKEIAQDSEAMCEMKSLTLQFDQAHGSGDYRISGDAVRLRELFLNLVDNAIKYTPAGGQVSLSLSQRDGNAIVAVRDNGIGIDGENIPNLFKRFYRISGSTSDTQNGTGLGLAISQRIAQLHNGKIEVNSKKGVGTTFTVILPLIKI